MALPNGPVARVIKTAREDRLTVAQVIERLQQLPQHYPTTAVDVVESAPDGGYRIVEFVR